MSARGFTLVELLVAAALALGVVAAASALAAYARRTFLVEPAAIDVMHRARTAADLLAHAIGGAGGGLGLLDGATPLSARVPLVQPLVALEGGAGTRFTAIQVWRAEPGAFGRLAVPQPGSAGVLTMDQSSPGACPQATGACGFRQDDVALIVDEYGRADVFSVASTGGAGELQPDRPLAFAFGQGAWVVAARVERLGLARQPDGSQVLVRLTAAGAREPVIDGVVDVAFDVWATSHAPWVQDGDSSGLAAYGLPPPSPTASDPGGRFPQGEHCMVTRVSGTPASTLANWSDEAGGLARLTPADLDDGPWCPYPGAPGAFDADLFRIRRVDIRVRVEAQPAEMRGAAGAWFRRAGTADHDPLRWVPDRTVTLQVAVGR